MSTQFSDAAGLERQVNRLASERTILFAKASSPTGLSKSDHARLSVIARELDDCFALRRKQRAARDARRFPNK
jgi:hypothetical protein